MYIEQLMIIINLKIDYPCSYTVIHVNEFVFKFKSTIPSINRYHEPSYKKEHQMFNVYGRKKTEYPTLNIIVLILLVIFSPTTIELHF